MKMFKVQMEEGGPALISKDALRNSWVWTEAEVSNLPEFTGF